MKILVDQSGYALLNIGDVAMLQVAVSRLRAMFPQSQIGVLTSDAERLRAYCPKVTALPVRGRSMLFSRGSLFGRFANQLESLERYIVEHHSGTARRLANLKHRVRRRDRDDMDEFYSALEEADLVVAAGGGYITDSFERHATHTLMMVALAGRMNKRIALFGQGIGPIRNPSLFVLLKALCNADLIALREPSAGVSILDRVGVDRHRVCTTGDDAVESAFSHGLESGNRNGIGVCIRVARYSGISENVLPTIKDALHSIPQSSTSLVPLPISSSAQEDDAVILEKVSGFQCPRPSSVVEVIQAVGQCRLVVTGSYHAAVFALAQGIPAVCLTGSDYYRLKFDGLRDLFGAGCVVVDIDQSEWADELKRQVTHLWDQGHIHRDELLNAAQAQMASSRAAYEQVAQWFSGVHGERVGLQPITVGGSSEK